MTQKGTTQKSTAPKRRRKPSQQKYVRNLLGVPVAVRLRTNRRIELAPRGMRGDILPINSDEQKDEIYLLNINRLFECITEDDVQDIVAKQATNQQQEHPAFAQLRNHLGQEYERREVVIDRQQDRDVVVGQVKPDGTVVQDGLNVTRAELPGTVDNPARKLTEESEEAVFDEAPANPGLLGAEENPIHNLKVTVEPVQREN